jgi:hypothetical protein
MSRWTCINTYQQYNKNTLPSRGTATNTPLTPPKTLMHKIETGDWYRPRQQGKERQRQTSTTLNTYE